MAHSTAIPAARQSATPRSDWYTFLCSAFLNGLKAYGASLMVISPTDPIRSQNTTAAPLLVPCTPEAALFHQPKAAIKPAILRTKLPKPAWSRA